jgi:phosphatidylserine/phosphatidylglycerophosphate/cardiolipin synthase-like enzyme
MPIERTNQSGRYVVEQLFAARASASICSPYISFEYAQKIAKLAERGVSVRVLTSDKIVEPNFRIREYFAEVKRKQGLDTLKTLVISHRLSFEHSKMYIVDDQYAVIGSANLTRAGMWENGETIDIYRTHRDVQLAREAFESAWKDALKSAFGNYSTNRQNNFLHYRTNERSSNHVYQMTSHRKKDGKGSIFEVIKREMKNWIE